MAVMTPAELGERYRSFATPDVCARLHAALIRQLADASFAPDFAQWPDLAEKFLGSPLVTTISGGAAVACRVHAQFANLGEAHIEHATWYARGWPDVVAADLTHILEVFFGRLIEDRVERRAALDQAIDRILSRPAGFIIRRSVARPARAWAQNEALAIEAHNATAARIKVVGLRWRRRLAKAAPLAWQLAGGTGELPPVHVSAGRGALSTTTNAGSRGRYYDGQVYLNVRPAIMARLARAHRWPDMDELTDETFLFEPCLSDPFGRPSPLLTLLHELIHAATDEQRPPEPDGRDAVMIKASPAFAKACAQADTMIQGLAIFTGDEWVTRSKVVFREVLTHLAALELEPALRAQTPEVSWPALSERKDVNGYEDGTRLMRPLLAKAEISAIELLHHPDPWPVLLKAASDLAGPAGAEAMIADALEPLDGGTDLGWLGYDFGRRHSLEPPDLALDLARIEN